MNDLAEKSVETLTAMKARLTNWIVYIAVIDLLLVGVFAWVVIAKSPAVALPLVPVLMIPAIALVPCLRRTGAIRRELERRQQR